MKSIILALLLRSASASATTAYYHKGKAISRADSIRLSLADPRAKVLKVNVTWVQLNQNSMRMNKISDAGIQDIPRK